jgi:hypothetical protein
MQLTGNKFVNVWVSFCYHSNSLISLLLPQKWKLIIRLIDSGEFSWMTMTHQLVIISLCCSMIDHPLRIDTFSCIVLYFDRCYRCPSPWHYRLPCNLNTLVRPRRPAVDWLPSPYLLGICLHRDRVTACSLASLQHQCCLPPRPEETFPSSRNSDSRVRNSHYGSDNSVR